jgi:hypothetical protein
MKSSSKDVFHGNERLYECVVARTDLDLVSERSTNKRYLRTYNVSDHIHGRQHHMIECVPSVP